MRPPIAAEEEVHGNPADRPDTRLAAPVGRACRCLKSVSLLMMPPNCEEPYQQDTFVATVQQALEGGNTSAPRPERKPMTLIAHRSGSRSRFVVHGGLLLLLTGAFTSVPTDAQGRRAGAASPQDTTVRAGAHYSAGGLHRFLFGQDYRDLWTTSVRVEVLNMRTFGGGLTPTTAGGGRQTKSLRFRGNDRHEYSFRSIDKDPDVLPPAFEGTIVQRIVEDQISSAYPPGPAVTAPLMEAAGILHTNPQMVVLPDDPALGQFRERFAGTLGFIEARAITGPGLEPFAGAAEIIDGNEIFERVSSGPRDRVDTRAFLKARLFDFFIGDWDRHRGQWGWARFGDQPVTHWVPLPEDRDQAFVRYDGLLPSLGRITNPQLISFGDDYASILGLHWNAQEVDRYFLTDLEKPIWDSVATALQARLTNAAIERAAAALPREYRSIDSTRLVRALKARRDKLPQVADRFYRFLAREVDVHATDESDRGTIERHLDGAVEIALAGGSAGEPYFHRRFDPSETSEIRLYLHGGDDRVGVRGQGSGAITLRIIGGSGSDEVFRSSQAGGIRFYTSDGDRTSGPAGVKVDRRSYTAPPKASINEPPPRDWGHQSRPVLWGGFGPDVGLFFGAGLYRMQFGFRHHPFASRIRVRAGYATEASTGRAGLLMQFRRSNSGVRFEIDARASGIEVLRFHGLGNEVLLAPGRFDDSEFFRVNQNQFSLEPSLVLPLGSSAELAFGPSAQYTTTDSIAGRFLATLFPLYGADDFGQLGGQASVQVDTRDVPAAATRGVWFTVGGSVYPKIWDVDSTTFGEVHGEVATYLTARPATLALRAGGKKVWGTFPFFESAFIGDARTVRLGRQNRFAGDAAVWGNAELRLALFPIFLVLPAKFGIFGIGDIGRVFLEGESTDRWHPAVGGGIWLAFLTSAGTVSAAVTRSEVGTAFPGRTGVYVQAGFAY